VYASTIAVCREDRDDVYHCSKMSDTQTRIHSSTQHSQSASVVQTRPQRRQRWTAGRALASPTAQPAPLRVSRHHNQSKCVGTRTRQSGFLSILSIFGVVSMQHAAAMDDHGPSAFMNSLDTPAALHSLHRPSLRESSAQCVVLLSVINLDYSPNAQVAMIMYGCSLLWASHQVRVEDKQPPQPPPPPPPPPPFPPAPLCTHGSGAL
jgi:hypothetical protein